MVENPAKTGAVMVVGGGIAGIQTSLDLAEMGFYVYLVEKSPAIGGRMAQLDKTFPTNDCSMCIISPKLNDVGGHINVEVLTNAELLDVTGEPGAMKAKILKKARHIDLEKCTGCGDCAKACPIEVPNEFNQGIDSRKVTFKPYAQAYPNAFAIKKLDTSPCTVACPAHVNAHGYVALVAQGRYKDAMEVIMDVLPLPGTLGRICPHPCEAECRRGQVEAPISIRDLKRFAADNADIMDIDVKCAEAQAEKVAIVGAGPAGLSAAYHLARKGYKSTIFEALPVSGGMLRVGIPDYRLPPAVLEREVEAITRLGVEIKYNQPLGPDLTIDDLFKQGYKAVFLAVGAHQGMDLKVPGEETEGVIQGVKFLKDFNLGLKPWVGRKVAIIGGGNVAMDVARTVRRLGVDEVTIVYRRTRTEMPAWEEEIEAALIEGIKIEYLAAPQQVISGNGKVAALRCIRMELGEPDNSGRRRPVPKPGSEFDLDVDMIVPAIGQMPVLGAGAEGIKMTRFGTVQVDAITLETNQPGVFAGGDMQTGPWVAIGAVAAGLEAAVSIDRYLRGQDLKAGREPINPEEKNWRDIPLWEEKKPRAHMALLPLEKRIAGFDEVELGFDPEIGQAEAARCLSCGICCDCFRCVEACLPHAVSRETHAQKDEVVELDVGSIVLAPGFDPFDPSVFMTYKYAEFPNVVTALEFERILSASGPYQGHLVRPSDHQEPKKIAWLQCVGSRDINACDRPYCSAVCCMYAIKEAVIAKEHAKDPAFEASIFYMDMRTYGKDFEKYYERAKDAGVSFIRSRVHTIYPQPDGGVALEFVGEDGSPEKQSFDMVVLSIGMEPSKGFADLAKRLDVNLNQEGFVASSSFDPVATSRPGIYACGAINEPKDIPISVMEASAAASAAASNLADVRFTKTRTLEYPEERDVGTETPRIGVFVCHCGINIGGIVNVPSVAEYAKTLPFVEFATDNLFTCSQDTQGKIKEAIVEYKLNRVVVASCSPRTHEPMFRETLQQAGLNKYLFEMANIRDHNSWVHQALPEKATTKARDLVRAAVAKAALLQPMHQTAMGLTKVALVVGGGVAGMTAALALAEQGYPVHLVEKSGALGGNALRLNTTWLGEDIKTFTKSLAEKVKGEKLITLYLNSEIKHSSGFLGNFETEIAAPGGTVTVAHGAVVVATGGRPSTPTEYLYGQNKRVLTSLEMDEVLAGDGSPIKKADTAVFIQCVGSREPQRPYCSKICCTHSVESAVKLKELNPQAKVYILYRDVRTYGFREKLYKEARSKGVIFIRYDLDHKPTVEALGPDKLMVTVIDHVLGRPIKIEADVVTLASGIEPNEAKSVAEAFKVAQNAEGFFLEAHMKLRPVDFATEGMFLAGLAHYPKPIEETIAQARAAAARATTILAKDFIKVGGVVAVVTPEKCAVCLTCVRTCPFHVPRIGEEGYAIIEPAICQGCGACVAECPGKAITLQHFTDDQILAVAQALVG